MTESSPNLNPVPPNRPRKLPWWLPGAAVGLLASIVAFATAQLASEPTDSHKARALIQFRTDDRDDSPHPGAAQRRRFFVTSTDLLTRVVADPAVAQLPTIKEWSDPVAELEQRLVVEDPAPSVLEISLTGGAPEDLKAILDHLVKRFVADLNSIENKQFSDRLAALERLRASVQMEIDLQEKAIEIRARNSGVEGSGVSGAHAYLHQRHLRAEAQLVQGQEDALRLKAQADALRASTAESNPDPVEVARLVDADARVALLLADRAEATAALEREKAGGAAPAAVAELQTKLDRAEKVLAAVRTAARLDAVALLKAAEGYRTVREIADLERKISAANSVIEDAQRTRDATRKVLENTTGNETSVETMRRALEPQREAMKKIQAQLIEQRVAGDRLGVAPFGATTVAPVEVKHRMPRAALTGVAAFAAAFVLVVAIKLIGLAFRAPRVA